MFVSPTILCMRIKRYARSSSPSLHTGVLHNTPLVRGKQNNHPLNWLSQLLGLARLTISILCPISTLLIFPSLPTEKCLSIKHSVSNMHSPSKLVHLKCTLQYQAEKLQIFLLTGRPTYELSFQNLLFLPRLLPAPGTSYCKKPNFDWCTRIQTFARVESNVFPQFPSTNIVLHLQYCVLHLRYWEVTQKLSNLAPVHKSVNLLMNPIIILRPLW